MENKISKYISYAEAVKSQVAERYGLNNTPNEEQLANMKNVGEMFDLIREHFNVPLYVSSFFRSKEVNTKAGGSKTSQHMTGEAIDIDCDVYGGIKNSELFKFIKDNCTFDQLIWEYGDSNEPAWVHFSLKRNLKENRGQIIKIK